MERIFKAFLNSMRGLRWGFVNEPALRQELILLAIGLPLAALIAPNLLWFALMLSGLLLLLAVELLNTGLEKLCDFITAGRHETIGAVKDMGSAAVFCLLALNAGLWGWAAWMKLT